MPPIESADAMEGDDSGGDVALEREVRGADREIALVDEIALADVSEVGSWIRLLESRLWDGGLHFGSS